jgi:CBS-domain-containing membrane protein
MGSVSLDYIISPILSGTLIILVFGIIINRLILKKKYPI